MGTREANSFDFFFLLLFQVPFTGSVNSLGLILEDRLFTMDEIGEMKRLLSSEETIWNFRQRRENNIDISGTESREQTSQTASCYSWFTKITPENFMDLSAWRKLAKMVSSDCGVKSSCEAKVITVEGQINIKASHRCIRSFTLNDNDMSSFVGVIFLMEDWKRNSYGELVVYDKGEVLRAVHPKPGRCVIFPANLEHVIKPPAIDFPGRLYAMNVYITVSDETKQVVPLSWKEGNAFQQEPSFKLLKKAELATPMQIEDVKQFMTRNFTTVDDRSIVVLDEIIPANDLDALMYTVSNSGYNDNAAGIDSTDNVQWIMAFEVEEFVQTSMWQLFSHIVTTVSGKEGYYPYDIGCNNIQSVDTTTIHTDCEPDENEFTLLVYLNQNWTENHHGETVFFSDMDGSEVIFAVRPKYGRIAIFHGSIPHSARPPSLTFPGMVDMYLDEYVLLRSNQVYVTILYNQTVRSHRMTPDT